MACARAQVAAGTAGEDHSSATGVDPESEAGLVGGHAYSVLDCQVRASGAAAAHCEAEHAVPTQEFKGAKLVKLRNPWLASQAPEGAMGRRECNCTCRGRFEWRGAWSDSSPLVRMWLALKNVPCSVFTRRSQWTEEAKTALHYTQSEGDGIFWMTYEVRRSRACRPRCWA